MRKIILSISAVAVLSLSFSGCANNGLGIGSATVKQVFESGTIESSQKVLVSKDMMASVTGAGIGAVAGAVIGAKESGGDAVKGGLVGAGIGAVAGFVGGYLLDNNEKEAFEISIKNEKTNEIRKAYLEQELPLNSLLEYIVREDGTVTNIDVKKIGTPKEIIKEKVVVKEKIIEKPVYKTKEVIKEKIVEKPVIKEVKVPVLPVNEKTVEESAKKVETETKKSVW